MRNLLVLEVRQHKQHLHHRVHIAAVAQVDHPREPGPVQRHQFRPGFLQEIPLVVLLIQVQLHLRHILLSLQKNWNKIIILFPLKKKPTGNFSTDFFHLLDIDAKMSQMIRQQRVQHHIILRIRIYICKDVHENIDEQGRIDNPFGKNDKLID